MRVRWTSPLATGTCRLMTGAAEWIGQVGQAWAHEWTRTDRAFAPLTQRLLAALDEIAPERGRCIDIGCGAGETAIALAALRPDLAIVGADISDDLIAAARQRSSAPNLAFIAGDAVATAAAQAPIDLFISRHGVMFFDDPAAAFTALRDAAARGARLLFTCFRDWSLNSFISDLAPLLGGGPPPADQPGPFAFADEGHVRAILATSGWTDVQAEPIDFAFRVGEGPDPVADGVAFLSHIGPAARALREWPQAERPALLAALADRCRARLNGDAVDFPAAAWLWSASAPAKGTP